MQDRIGPNRVGPFGLLQPIADGLKFLLKEEIIPRHVDKLFFLLAPAIAVGTARWPSPSCPSARPSTPSASRGHRPRTRPQTSTPERKQEVKDYNDTYQFVIAPHIDIGILFVFAVGSLAVYGIILGGWSSNNKYSLLGALRSSAQIISYEIPLGMSVLGVVLVTGSLNLERIIGTRHTGRRTAGTSSISRWRSCCS